VVETDGSSKTALSSLQVLRGIAVTLVVFHHAGNAITHSVPAPQGIWLFSFPKLVLTGAAGVDIFFLISGFIMVYVSPPYRNGSKPAGDFLIRRLIRIYPMYALVTLAMIALAAFQFYRRGVAFPFGIERIVASLGFVPSFDDAGNVAPILGQGWTLFYEMFFYLCFAGVLRFSKAHLLPPLIAIFSAVMAGAYLFGSPDNATAVFFRDPIVIEFLFGCGIGILFQRGSIMPSMAWVWFLASTALLGCGSAIGAPDPFRFLWWGLPAAGLLVAFLKLEMIGVAWPRALLLLGDASYSVYLVHVLMIYNLRDFARTHFTDIYGGSGDLMTIGLAVVSIGLGVAVYLLVERPLHHWLNRLYRRSKTTSLQAVAPDQLY
jgi:exopolysaccharide production protein ExoZ